MLRKGSSCSSGPFILWRYMTCKYNESISFLYLAYKDKYFFYVY